MRNHLLPLAFAFAVSAPAAEAQSLPQQTLSNATSLMMSEAAISSSPRPAHPLTEIVTNTRLTHHLAACERQLGTSYQIPMQDYTPAQIGTLVDCVELHKANAIVNAENLDQALVAYGGELPYRNRAAFEDGAYVDIATGCKDQFIKAGVLTIGQMPAVAKCIESEASSYMTPLSASGYALITLALIGAGGAGIWLGKKNASPAPERT